MLLGVRPIVVPPKVKPLSPNGAGKDWNSEPATIAISASMATNRPRVTITALSSGPPSTGRTITRSMTAPSTKPAASATTKATQ